MDFFNSIKSPAGPPEPVIGQSYQIAVVKMRKSHIKQVLHIEKEVFPKPWTAALYESELGQPASRCYYVVKAERSVIGYGGYMVVLDEAHVTTLAVAPRWQKNKIGMIILLQLLNDAVRLGLRAVTLEVRASNIAAQKLYFQFGFQPVGIRKNYYAEVNEDAVVMWTDSIQSEQYRERLGKIALYLQEKANLHSDIESKAQIVIQNK